MKRRLAAILSADVVGYSRLMEHDESGTIESLKERRQTILVPLVARHDGRIVKVIGDGVLVEFASAVNAVTCAVELQEMMAKANQSLQRERQIQLRVGINLGDVIVEGGDVYGDGVNVAARLQSLAGPGDIFVSANVYDQVKRKIEVAFLELGPQSIKNISEPVIVYQVLPSGPEETRVPSHGDPLPLPAKPSIAVLPFTNMSNDPEQETFVDGLTEDLITDLSQDTGLFVIARNSAFAYKGRAMDVRHIARSWRTLPCRGQRASDCRTGPHQCPIDRRNTRRSHLGGSV